MENVRVVVRVRPFLPGEKNRECVMVSNSEVHVGDEHCFTFDDVLKMSATTMEVNQLVGDPLVAAFVDGHTVSAIAYGQTGTGKTHTMSCLSSYVMKQAYGMVTSEGDVVTKAKAAVANVGQPVASDDSPTHANAQAEFRFSAVEVYNEKISDLVTAAASPVARNAHPLSLRESSRTGIFIQGLSEVVVESSEELLSWIQRCTASRRTAATQINEVSSRSHCLLTVTLMRRGFVSRFALVDLAGSERQAKLERRPSLSFSDSDMSKAASRRQESISINSGLLALGNVISALCKGEAYVPYRSSKLTRLLQPILSGNSKTTMIACISPTAASLNETLCTLKYANRAKSIRTSPLLVATASMVKEATQTNLIIGQQLDECKQRRLGARSPTFAHRSNSSGKRVNELMRQLESERRLTLRLKEDLFKAEYAAMMEADKRKSLEQQLIALETASGRSRSSGALTSLDALKPDDSESQKTVDINEKRGDSQEQIILTHFKEAHEVTHDSGRHDLVDIERSAKVCSEEGLDEVNGQSDCSTQEELLLEISKKEGFINRLQRQYHEAMCALRESRQKEQETLETKCRLEEELALVGEKLKLNEVMRLKKEGHCRTYKGYQKQLSKAGKVTVECKWMMREADAQLSTYEDDGQLIKQLLARVPGSNIELNRQLHGIREGKQREQGIITASYAHTISQLRFQVQESNAMVLRLRMQLRNKEREIARVRSRDNSISKLRSSSVSSEERSLSFSSLPRQLLKATDALSNSGVSDPHDDVELELRAIAILEKDLEELTAQRRKLRESVDNRRAPKDGLRDAWKLVKLFESTPQQGKRFTRCENTSGERRVVNHNRSGGPIKNVTVVSHPPKSLSKAEGRLGEVERNINSLLEAHRYHVQRLQRLRQGGLSASSPYVESGSGAPSSLMAGELLSDSPSG